MNDDKPKKNNESSYASYESSPVLDVELQVPNSKKSGGVPVGLGILLGVLMVMGGTGLNLFPDDGKDQVWEMLLGKLLLICGATLAVGGVFVLVAENKYGYSSEIVRHENIVTPKWAYVFAGVCFIVGILGGFIGAACGFVGGSMCIAFSRNQALSVPRQIYACILTVGFTWMAYFAYASQFATVMNSVNH